MSCTVVPPWKKTKTSLKDPNYHHIRAHDEWIFNITQTYFKHFADICTNEKHPVSLHVCSEREHPTLQHIFDRRQKKTLIRPHEICSTLSEPQLCPPLPSSALASPDIMQSSAETGQQHTRLLVSASPRHATSRGTSGAVSAPRPPPRDVWKHAWPCQTDATPCQAMSRTSWGLLDGFATAYWEPSLSVFLSFPGVTPSADLCVSLRPAVPNHSPAVWLIRTTSVISVKCSASFCSCSAPPLWL